MDVEYTVNDIDHIVSSYLSQNEANVVDAPVKLQELVHGELLYELGL